MKETEGEIYWRGYNEGLKKSVKIFRKIFRGGIIGRESIQDTIKRLKNECFTAIEKLIEKD